MKTKHTPGPWEIEWYECRADAEDVKARQAKKIGELFWKFPTAIGPLMANENHWAGMYLDVEEADARLIAAAPELLEALTDLRGTHALDAAAGRGGAEKGKGSNRKSNRE